MLFQKIKKNRKPNKIWVDKGSEFCNRSMTRKNDIEMYSTHKEVKSIVAETLIRALNYFNIKECVY